MFQNNSCFRDAIIFSNLKVDLMEITDLLKEVLTPLIRGKILSDWKDFCVKMKKKMNL